MTQAQLVTEPRVAAEAPPKCDRDCNKPAVFAYAWEWGEKGVCCSEHQFLLQQTAGTLSRSINFTPLQSASPIALSRDERAKLKGENYALEQEIEDLKARGSLLYSENTALTRQVQATSTRLRETELQLAEAKRDLTALGERLEERDAEHGSMVDEVQRLRTLQKFTPAPGATGSAGATGSTGASGEETTRVDGPQTSKSNKPPK